MIQSNKPLVVQVNARSGKGVEAIVVVSIVGVAFIPQTKTYTIYIQDAVEESKVEKTVSISVEDYTALKEYVLANNTFSETGTDLEVAILPHALLRYVTTDVGDNGKLIYGSNPEDWELVPQE